MLADIHILHQSEFYRINDFECHCDRCSVSQVEYDDSMFISFVRKGFFEFQSKKSFCFCDNFGEKLFLF